ncbi:MAG: clostripain-related cysteine peptidase [Hyalangium sp.]|uniref:clostripain-related cysteine peptidase n=1 Tax=Hyalangium sp. TaxID=2028555 RepID=UPI003899E52E
MKVQNPQSPLPRSVSDSASPPTTKALPPQRGNELVSPRSDAFDSKRGTQSRPAVLTGEVQGAAPSLPPGAGPISPKDIPAADWTMFVNLNADNNLESFGKADLNEMEAGGGSIPGKLNMIALVDGGSLKDPVNNWNTGTRLMYVTKDPNKSNKVISREIQVDPNSDLGKLLAKGNGELDTGSPEVLRAALDYVQKNTQSKHYMVDLWDHGNDWRGVSYDDHPNSNLDMNELKQALTGLPQKIDILSADACLMATVEVADTAKAAGADFLVGSEEVEPGTGWNYTDLLSRVSKLFDGDTSVSAEQMAKAVQDSYAAGPKDNVTVSVTDLSKLPGLNTKLNDFSDALVKAGGLQDKTLRGAYDKALRFDDADQMDLGDFAKRVAASTTNASLKTAANALLAELAKTTTEKGVGISSTAGKSSGSRDVAIPVPDSRNLTPVRSSNPYAASTGLTVYAPRGSVDADYKKAGSAWLNSHWNNVIKTYSSTPRS